MRSASRTKTASSPPIPKAPISAERLAAAADALDQTFPHEDVTLYLATLLSQDPETWGALQSVPQASRGRE